MRSCVYGMLAETFIHYGIGRSEGVIDLPVAREGGTGLPVIFGSGLKGALRQHIAEQPPGSPEDKKEDPHEVRQMFGSADDGAGDVCISDARLLLLPVRNLTGASMWITCPMVLERFQRDMQRFGTKCGLAIPKVDEGAALTVENKGANGHLMLEDQEFNKINKKNELKQIITFITTSLVLQKEVSKRLLKNFALLNDADFMHFARYGLSIVARNELKEETKTSNNLWYEEALPPDTIMYSGITSRSGNLNDFDTAMQKNPYLQVGGNATVGQGWFHITSKRSEGKA